MKTMEHPTDEEEVAMQRQSVKDGAGMAVEVNDGSRGTGPSTKGVDLHNITNHLTHEAGRVRTPYGVLIGHRLCLWHTPSPPAFSGTATNFVPPLMQHMFSSACVRLS